MLGLAPPFSSALATERHARFATEAASARWRRLLRQGHAVPSCGALAAQLPDVVVDPAVSVVPDPEAAATK